MPLGPVAIFWDYENCSPHHSAGCTVVDNIRQIAHTYGTIKLFKAYLELSEQTSSKSLGLRSELQSCGVSLTDCPHNGRKDVADKMMIVDMLTYAIDTPAPATIILISGDRDFVYAVSVLRFRRYHVAVIAPGSAHATLKSRASEALDWDHDVLGKPLREGHARHVSADVSSTRGTGTEYCHGTQRANRRHSFRDSFRNLSSSDTRSPVRTAVDGKDAVQDTLHVPNGYSSPSSPHQRATHPSLSDAHEPFVAPHDGNMAQAEPKLANAATISPIGTGITTFGDFSEAPQGPSTICDDLDEPSVGKRNRAPDTRAACNVYSPIGQNAAVASAGDKLRGNSGGDIARSGSTAPPTITGVHPHVSLSPTDAQAHAATPTATSPLDARTRLDSRTFVDSGSEQGRAPGAPNVPRGSAVNGCVRTGVGPPTIPVPLNSSPQGLPPGQFQPLIDVLDNARLAGQAPMLRSAAALQLVARNERVYQDAGVGKFREYAVLAQQHGVVALGGAEGHAWISLLPPWHGRGSARSS